MIRAIGPLAALAMLAAGAGCTAKHHAEIAVTVSTDGRGEIWLMRADGSNRSRLTPPAPQRHAVGAMTPAWSPDGERLAYAYSARGGQRPADIYVVDVDGGDVHRLTNGEGVDADPTWSPNGERIAFTRIADLGRESAHWGIVVMSADGGDEVEIVHSVSGRFVFAPAWSPDGSTIAFTREVVSGDDFEHARITLYTVAPDGSGARKLVDGAAEPAWSPDGKRLAFTSVRDPFGRTCFEECKRSGEIYIADADGGHPRRLTTSKADDHSPAWSPDGRLLAFVSDRSGTRAHDNEIYVMRADGSELHRITHTGAWNLDPAWRPKQR
jgi:TolB protein